MPSAFRCGYCGMNLDRIIDYDNEFRGPDGCNAYKCPKCERVFTHPFYLRKAKGGPD